MQDILSSSSDDTSEKANSWALGIILYEMLFGRSPWEQYESGTPPEIFHQRVSNQSGANLSIPPKPRISLKTENLLRRLIIQDQSKRLSFEEIIERLRSKGNSESFEQEKCPSDSLSQEVFLEKPTIHHNLKAIEETLTLREKETQKLRSSFNRLQEKNDSLIFEIDIFQSREKQLKVDFHNLREENERLQHQIASLTQKSQNLFIELKKVSVELDKEKQEHLKTQKSSQELRDNLAKSERTYQASNQRMNGMISNLEKEIKAYKARLEEMSEKASEEERSNNQKLLEWKIKFDRVDAENKNTNKKMMTYLDILEKGHAKNLESLKGLELKVKASELDQWKKNIENVYDSLKEEQRKICNICYTEKKNRVLRPCGHTFCDKCCEEFQKRSKQCPVDKRGIEEAVIFYDN